MVSPDVSCRKPTEHTHCKTANGNRKSGDDDEKGASSLGIPLAVPSAVALKASKAQTLRGERGPTPNDICFLQMRPRRLLFFQPLLFSCPIRTLYCISLLSIHAQRSHTPPATLARDQSTIAYPSHSIQSITNKTTTALLLHASLHSSSSVRLCTSETTRATISSSISSDSPYS